MGAGYGALHRVFGTRDEILRAAIRFCADTEACLAQEPLRVSATGREAILAMLEENVRFQRAVPIGSTLPGAGCIIRSVQLKFRLSYLLALLCAGAPVLFPQDRSPAVDPDRDIDVQAIYSWTITHSAAHDRLYLIAPETYQSDYPPERCLEIPLDHAADFREIRAEFDRRRDTTHVVPKPLSTPKPYVILDPNATKEILKSALLSDSPIIRERFPGALHLWLFSEVSFNQRRTVALVHVDSWCGGLCDNSYWVAFEKANEGVWQMRPWAKACVAVACNIDLKIPTPFDQSIGIVGWGESNRRSLQPQP